jgi:hypothetical protein
MAFCGEHNMSVEQTIVSEIKNLRTAEASLVRAYDAMRKAGSSVETSFMNRLTALDARVTQLEALLERAASFRVPAH